MDQYSKLNTTLLTNKCNEAIHNLNQDIEDNETVLAHLQSIVEENRLSGAAFTAFKNMLADYYAVTKLNIEADESDIADFNILLSNATESFDGSVICSAYDRAQADRDENRKKANWERIKAAGFNSLVITPVIGGGFIKTYIENPYEKNVTRYSALADECQLEMDKWQAKKDAFDSIETNTSGLFQKGMGAREAAKTILGEMDKICITGDYGQMVAIEALEAKGGLEYIGELYSDSYYLSFKDEKIKEEYSELVQLEKDIDFLKEKMNNTSNSSALSAMQSQLNQWQKKEREMQREILEKMNHSQEFIDGFEFLINNAFYEEDCRKIFWYWLAIDEVDDLSGIGLPHDWMEEINRNDKICDWIMQYNLYPEEVENFYELQVYNKMVLQFIVSGNVDDKTGISRKIYAMIFNDEKANSVFEKGSFIFRYAKNFLSGGASQTFVDGMKDVGNVVYEWATEKDKVTDLYEYMLGSFALFGLVEQDLVLTGIENLTGNRYSWLSNYHNEIREDLYYVGDFFEENVNEIKDDYKLDRDMLLKMIRNAPGNAVNSLYTFIARVPVINHIDKLMINDHYQHNVEGWDEYKNTHKNDKMPDGYGDLFFIEKQNSIGNSMYYGKYEEWLTQDILNDRVANDKVNLYADDNLCEVIALDNIITFKTGEEVDLPLLIMSFETKGVSGKANIGTAPGDLYNQLTNYGIESEFIDTDSLNYDPNNYDDFDKLLEEYDSFILTDWNTGDTEGGIHTMAITVTTGENGEVMATRHNDGGVERDMNGKQIEVGYTTEMGKEGLYHLLCEYTNGNTNDGTISVMGIKR